MISFTKPLLIAFVLVFSNGVVSPFVPSVHAADTLSVSDDEKILKKRIQFWIRIYTEFTTSQGVIHDAKYPEIIFESMDFTASKDDYRVTGKESHKRRQKRIDNAKDFYQKALLSIHHKKADPSKLNITEKKIYDLYAGNTDPNRFFHAAHDKRVRFQLGQKDRFVQGIFYSGRYLKTMEKIFKEQGLFSEMTRLPFVESSFNLNARSKVGASGIWQFMRSTGKLFMRIDDTIDERNDPILATVAAAQLLKHNYEALNNWPLAITAYNHGRKGLMRAVRKVGSDSLSDIIENYRSRSFGFASSNFFAELMAAIEVEKNAEKYFGKLEKDKQFEYEEIKIDHFVDVRDLSTYTRIPIDIFAEYNPSLTDNVFQGKRLIPAGFTLKLPQSLKDNFLAKYKEMPEQKKYIAQRGSHLDLSHYTQHKGKRGNREARVKSRNVAVESF